jgi:ATP-dependent helicase/nuclease subunit A
VWPDPRPQTSVTAPLPALPAWATIPAATVERPAQPLSPSNLGGAKALPGEGLDDEAAKARGTALHLLLQHLPGTDPADHPALAAALIPDTALRAELLAEGQAVIAAHPALFTATALTEVEITATLLGQPMLGTVDRLIVEPARILAIDYKSNHTTPATPDQTPDGILRQMGAYAAALAQIYPGRRIETAILWTRHAQLMPLDPDIVSAALARTTIP